MVEFGTPRHELILHQYDISPLTRKVKMALSIKGLGWRACTQPVIAPKPDLVALTRVAIAVFPCSRLAPHLLRQRSHPPRHRSPVSWSPVVRRWRIRASVCSSAHGWTRRGNTRALSAQRLSGWI